MIRLAMFASIAFAILSGIWATFGTPDAAITDAIFTPDPAKVEEIRSYVQPVLEWIGVQTPASVTQLGKDAAEDVRNSLQEDVPDPGVTTAPARRMRHGGGEVPVSAAGPAGSNAQPGIDWYRDGGRD